MQRTQRKQRKQRHPLHGPLLHPRLQLDQYLYQVMPADLLSDSGPEEERTEACPMRMISIQEMSLLLLKLQVNDFEI